MRKPWRWFLAAALAALALALSGPYLIPLPTQPDLTAVDLAPAGSRLMEVDGVQTVVQEAGPPSGPPVVLLHGFGGSTFNYRYTLPEDNTRWLWT